jgi:hypothetical protein
MSPPQQSRHGRARRPTRDRKATITGVDEVVEALKAAGTDRATFNAALASVSGRLAKVNAIQHGYIGGREGWPSKRAALQAIEETFRERAYQAVKLTQVDKARVA